MNKASNPKTPAQAAGTTIPNANILLLGMCMGVMTFWLFALAMTPLGPTISENLGLPAAAISLPVGFAGLVSGILIVPAGVLADRYGCVRMFRIGIAFSIAGSLLCGLANGQMMLIGGRLLQGVSAALVMPATLALVKSYFSEEDRPKALSFWSMSSFGSAGVCSFFGGFVATTFGWRWVFLLTVPVALLAVYLLRHAPESQLNTDRTKPFDSMGFISLLLALMAINLAINRGPIWGWVNPLTLGCFVAFVLLLPVFLSVERKHVAPIVDLGLLKNKTYDAAVIANFLLNTGLGGMYILLTYLQKGRGLSAFDASLTTLSYLVVIMIMIRVGEKLGRRYGSRLPMATGAMCSAIGFGLMSLTFLQGESYYISVVVGFAMMGLGNGIFATPATSIAVAEAPPDKVGAATAIFKMASSLGGSLGIAACGAIFHGTLASDPTRVDLAGQYGIGFCLVTLFIASIISLTMLPRPVKLQATTA